MKTRAICNRAMLLLLIGLGLMCNAHAGRITFGIGAVSCWGGCPPGRVCVKKWARNNPFPWRQQYCDCVRPRGGNPAPTPNTTASISFAIDGEVLDGELLLSGEIIGSEYGDDPIIGAPLEFDGVLSLVGTALQPDETGLAVFMPDGPMTVYFGEYLQGTVEGATYVESETGSRISLSITDFHSDYDFGGESSGFVDELLNDEINGLGIGIDLLDPLFAALENDGSLMFQVAEAMAVGGLVDVVAPLDDGSLTNPNERLEYIRNELGTWIGDSNIDGEFNSSDFVSIFVAGEYEDGVDLNSGWRTGDWNGDGEFDSTDFVVAFVDGGFEQGPLPSATVPEPNTMTVLLTAAFCILRIGKRIAV